jgi:hypothetical protein
MSPCLTFLLLFYVQTLSTLMIVAHVAWMVVRARRVQPRNARAPEEIGGLSLANFYVSTWFGSHFVLLYLSRHYRHNIIRHVLLRAGA